MKILYGLILLLSFPVYGVVLNDFQVPVMGWVSLNHYDLQQLQKSSQENQNQLKELRVGIELASAAEETWELLADLFGQHLTRLRVSGWISPGAKNHIGRLSQLQELEIEFRFTQRESFEEFLDQIRSIHLNTFTLIFNPGVQLSVEQNAALQRFLTRSQVRNYRALRITPAEGSGS